MIPIVIYIHKADTSRAPLVDALAFTEPSNPLAAQPAAPHYNTVYTWMLKFMKHKP